MLVYNNSIGYYYKKEDIIFEPLWAIKSWWHKPLTLIKGKRQSNHSRHRHQDKSRQYKKKV
jgi:hypothetical protein